LNLAVWLAIFVTGARSHSGGVAAQAPDGAGDEDREPHGQVQDPAPLHGCRRFPAAKSTKTITTIS